MSPTFWKNSELGAVRTSCSSGISNITDETSVTLERVSFLDMRQRILQIGNYPPPFCGWSVQTKLLVEEIRRRGHVCDVLNLSENHAKKSREYTDVQNGVDYLCKLIRFAFRRYRFQVHVNGQSTTGYILAVMAAVIGRLAGTPVALSWRGGLHQRYFPCSKARSVRWAYRLLFRLSGKISCNNLQVKEAIEQYGISSERVVAIPAFSMHHVQFQQVLLARDTEIVQSMTCRCYVRLCDDSGKRTNTRLLSGLAFRPRRCPL
jgi:hypothetical protein